MKRNLSMCWSDYKKAYYMVPHSWILDILGMIGVAESVRKLLRGSISDWKTMGIW